LDTAAHSQFTLEHTDLTGLLAIQLLVAMDNIQAAAMGDFCGLL